MWGEAMGPCRTSARLGCLIEHPSVNLALTGDAECHGARHSPGRPRAEGGFDRAAICAVGLEAQADDRGRQLLGGYAAAAGLGVGLGGGA